jgi:CBS domain containing-hemolysin-like protein
MSTLSLILSICFCGCLIFLSFCLSASEVAIFSLSRLQLRFLKENFRSAYDRIRFLLNDPSGVLITILVTNEIVNVLLSVYVTQFVQSMHITNSFLGLSAWVLELILATLITAFLILFFCEISPKVIANKMNRLVAPLTVRFLYFFYRRLFFVRMFFRFLLKLLHVYKVSDKSQNTKNLVFQEADLLYLAAKAEKEGTIGLDEGHLIRKVFALDDIFVSSVMHEFNSEVALSADQTLQDAYVLIKVHKMPRIPVLSYDRSEVLGILYTKDLLNIPPEYASQPVLNFVRKPFFVEASMQLSALFRQFKSRKTHIAIVNAVNGQAKGYITMEDILNCLFVNLFEVSSGLKRR